MYYFSGPLALKLAKKYWEEQKNVYDLGVMRYNKKRDALKEKNMKKFNKINKFHKRLHSLRAHHL